MSTPILLWSKSSDGHVGVSAPANRIKFFEKNQIDKNNVVDIIPAHGNKIKIATGKDAGKYFEEFDGVITKDKNLVLAVTCADCMPIAVFDPETRTNELIHCGWRGLENGILKKSVRQFRSSAVNQLIIYIGPHICAKHYVRDLSGEAKNQLIKLGVKEKNIQIDLACTFEDKNFYSYRGGDSKYRNLYLLTMK